MSDASHNRAGLLPSIFLGAAAILAVAGMAAYPEQVKNGLVETCYQVGKAFLPPPEWKATQPNPF